MKNENLIIIKNTVNYRLKRFLIVLTLMMTISLFLVAFEVGIELFFGILLPTSNFDWPGLIDLFWWAIWNPESRPWFLFTGAGLIILFEIFLDERGYHLLLKEEKQE